MTGSRSPTGAGADREPGMGKAEEGGEENHHCRRDGRSEQVERTDENVADRERRIVEAEVEAVDLRAPDELGAAFENIGEPERGHEQSDRRLVDQWLQHRSLDRNAG